MAQKFSTSSLPPKFPGVMTLPLLAVMSKPGAESPTLTMRS